MFDPRTLRLLAQYTEHYFHCSLVDRPEPPHELDDMPRYRLENLDNLEEVIDGVLKGGTNILEGLDPWQLLKKWLTELREDWEAGQYTYEQFPKPQFIDVNWEETGRSKAREYSDDDEKQMWFYEGWLVAHEAEA